MCLAGAIRGDIATLSAVGFLQSYASNLEPSIGCSLVLSLLRLHTSSPATQASMPAVLHCTVAAARAMPREAFEGAPSQWHEAVLAELKHHVQTAGQEGSSVMLGMQTGTTPPTSSLFHVFTFALSAIAGCHSVAVTKPPQNGWSSPHGASRHGLLIQPCMSAVSTVFGGQYSNDNVH